MSHQEQATLEKAGVCRQIVDEAIGRVAGALEACENLERGSSTIMDDDTRAMISDLRAEAKAVTEDLRRTRGSILDYALKADIDAVRSKVSESNAVLLRLRAVESAVSRQFDEAMADRGGPDRRIEAIEDPKLRTMARLLARNPEHAALPFDDLLELARSKVDPSRAVRRDLVRDVVSDACAVMEAGKVPEEAIEGVVGGDGPVSPLAVMDAAVREAADEAVRREAVAAIVKSITARGFIVKRSDIRRSREDDTVRIVASKPGGQKAEFSISLDGRFVYHFHGYEGQACRKDMEPMERDLEEVYGFRMTDRKVLWSNPDRNWTMHHAEMRTRRDS